MWKDFIWPSLKLGGKIVLLQYAAVLAGVVAIGLINLAAEGEWYVNWRAALETTTYWAWPIGFFVSGVFIWLGWLAHSLARQNAEQHSAVGGQDLRPSEPARDVTGFMATEYYALILNRTYVVYVAPEGVYGWKVHGPVDASDPTYYRHAQAALLDDPYLLPDRQARAKLLESEPDKCFFIPHHSIAGVRFVPGRKWGMGPVVHSGRLLVQQNDGKVRELILLGEVSGDEIAASIRKFGVTALPN